jgi:hypothetical protein
VQCARTRHEMLVSPYRLSMSALAILHSLRKP